MKSSVCCMLVAALASLSCMAMQISYEYKPTFNQLMRDPELTRRAEACERSKALTFRPMVVRTYASVAKKNRFADQYHQKTR